MKYFNFQNRFLALAGALLLGLGTNASASVTVLPDTNFPSPIYLSATVGTNSPSGGTQIYDASNENPSIHNVSVTGVDLPSAGSAGGTATASDTLNFGYSSSEIQFNSIASINATNAFNGTALEYQQFFLVITVTDQPITFKLQAEIDATPSSNTEAGLGLGTGSQQVASFSLSSNPSGTVYGTLTPGIYFFRETEQDTAESGATDSAYVYADLEFNPVPEPSTWALLGCGVVGLLGLALRRRVV